MNTRFGVLAVLVVLVAEVNRVPTASGTGQSRLNPFHSPDKSMKPEEKRLKDFWAGYYGAVKDFYGKLDHLDWVAYYQNHGIKINQNLKEGTQRTQYAPVFMVPTFQWALPNNMLKGPPDPLNNSMDKTFQDLFPTVESEKPPKEDVKKSHGSIKVEYKAVVFGTDAEANTKILNQLAADGWHYVGQIRSEMVAFHRPVKEKGKK